MSGSIGRSYLIQQWNDASSYSGEMIGNRLKESTDLYLANGKANIGLFEEKPKAAAKKSAFETITLADSHYERLANLSEELDKELESGKLSFDDWSYARKTLDVRLQKAWQRLSKARGWDDQPEELPELSFSLEACTEQRRGIKIDYSVLSADSVFSGLKDDNFFKQCACFVLTGCKALTKLLNNGKEILKEGLV
jgi:hypothetical protein